MAKVVTSETGGNAHGSRGGKPGSSMGYEATMYEELADGIASGGTEAAGDVLRYIVAPAMLDIIGPVEGRHVLDLYCGAGYLSRRLAAQGGHVTAVDSSDRLIGIASEINSREHHSINYAVAEPTDLSVIEDSTFDDMVCNMGLMITRDLAGTIAELARLVKLGGRFVFSIMHPCFCTPDAAWAGEERPGLAYKTVGSYYSEGWWYSDTVAAMRDDRTKVKHRTMSSIINGLSSRGFNVRRIAEPRPSPELVAVHPRLEIYSRLPVAMVVEAVFPYL